MRDLIYREDVLRGLDGMFPAEAKSEYQQGIASGLALAKVRIVSMPSVRQEWNNHTVACLLADMFGDSCACNFNGIDEWLPEKCDFADTACPSPAGVACWEQFLKHRGKTND